MEELMAKKSKSLMDMQLQSRAAQTQQVNAANNKH